MNDSTRRVALKVAAAAAILSYAAAAMPQEKHAALAQKGQERVEVKRADFESLGTKLEKLYSQLSQGEASIFEFLMENAVSAARQDHPPPKFVTNNLKPRFRFKPRGGAHLVAGGSDGLTIVITGRGKMIVVPPKGPLPTERIVDVLGAIRIDAR
jgi:hypothetical protein